MTDTFKPGERINWASSEGEIAGHVVSKVTSATSVTDVKGHTAKASRADPQYGVKGDTTGAEAIHKPSALTKP